MQNLQELTECCICTEIFTDPRILPCIHTFCLKCLQQTAVKNEIKAEEKMPCPFCRREFVIPTEGMSGLQKNFFMDRLVEITRLSRPVDKVTSCEICIEDNETEACDVPIATNYCIQCRKNICNLCCRYHNKFHKDHELLPLGCLKKDTLSRKHAAQYCIKHSKKKSELFCSDCNEIICIKCFTDNHQLHKCNEIDTSADSFRQQILDTTERVSNFSKEAVLKSESLLRKTSDFLKNIEREEIAVVTRGKMLTDLIDKCTQSLLDELNSIKLNHLKELETAKEENEFHKGILESFKEYCRELTSKGSSVEICRSALNINTREVELKQMHDIHCQKQITLEVSFEASKLEELLKAGNVVGKIKVEKKSEAEERKANVTETNSTVQHEVSILSTVQLDTPSCNSSYVIGVTKFMHSIYILSWSWNSFASNLYVFEDQSPFRLQKEIKIREFKNPFDITAIEESSCLFISDSDIIWKMTADDHRATKWMSIANEPYTLSASYDGHLLVLTEGQQLKSQVKIYKSDTKVISSLPLPIDIQSPRHISQSSNGEFIISHRNGRDGPWVISRLTSDGQRIISQCNPRDKGLSQQMDSLWYLCLDSDKNRLFVAVNCTVSVFDSISLNLKSILLTQETFRPYRLHYDAKKRQLIVGQSSGEVNIYEIN